MKRNVSFLIRKEMIDNRVLIVCDSRVIRLRESGENLAVDRMRSRWRFHDLVDDVLNRFR